MSENTEVKEKTSTEVKLPNSRKIYVETDGKRLNKQLRRDVEKFC